MKQSSLFSSRKGQVLLGLAFFSITVFLVVYYLSTYGLVRLTPCLQSIQGGRCGYVDEDLSELPEALLNFRIGIYLIFIPLIASLEYFLRALTPALFHRFRTQLANGRFYSRWLFRCLWSSLMLFLVALVFGIFSPTLHVTLIVLNILSHVFLMEMDRTNEDLSYVDWVPYVISTLLFIGQVIFMLAVGFDIGHLVHLPGLFRILIIVYLFLNVGFYFNAFCHYSGISKWRRFEFSDMTFSSIDWLTNAVMAVLLTMLMIQ
ncbi:MAG: hypothetical protein MZU97_00960 [Bacillus subtilis]|nr:hypothetical protein [Bacillus subtilis]